MSGRLTFICVLEANLAWAVSRTHDVGRCGFLSQSGPRGGQPSQQIQLELGSRLRD
jgi:hypothetical protein